MKKMKKNMRTTNDYIAGRYDQRGFRLVGRVNGGPFIRIDTYIEAGELVPPGTKRPLKDIREDCIFHAKELADFHKTKYGGVKRWKSSR